MYVFEDAPAVPYCGVPRPARQHEQQAEDGRVADAREAITVASQLVTAGELPYDAEQAIERLTEVIEDLLTLIAVRDERDALLEAAARKPFDDLAATVAEVEAERDGKGE